MAASATDSARASSVADVLSALMLADGSAKHSFVATYGNRVGPEAGRSLSDAVHHLSGLYGRHPGLADMVSERGHHAEIKDWVAAAVDGFARERAYLIRVVVAAGPLPSTPGQAESENATLSQRHAIDMLAQSDRSGCALGATMASVLDWRAIRKIIDAAARRFGIEPPTLLVPTSEETLEAAALAATNVGIERAICFGAQQILVQHRGLWDLLEARDIARCEG
ncbi:MAG: hypothetical protein AB7G25_13920 [Sphingomonadaceae bacterium]